MTKRYQLIDEKLFPYLDRENPAERELRRRDPQLGTVASYIRRKASYPVYKNTEVIYYDTASDSLEAQLRDLQKAKKFIFMEYHAIEEGKAFDKVKKILAQKAGEGLDVRIFYDDLGSIGFITTDFTRRMEALGIRCRVFNPFMPVLNMFLNNRDHRKITVIDGVVGYVGGYNLADEYFNLTQPYGYWKDTGIRLEGDAVRSLVVTFLEMWNAVREHDVDDQSFQQFLETGEQKEEEALLGCSRRIDELYVTQKAAAGGKMESGYVQPYADSPMDNENVGENVYISLIEKAERYIWFMTPYLIITDEMTHAMCLAAKRGVDVRIITPGIPDKKMVYHVTRSFYNGLAREGVRIYEYTPGFCHAKICVSDDKVCTCGSINLDYRSLYHHFENGCIIYGGYTVGDIRKDFESSFKVSREVTEYYAGGRGRLLRLGQMFLRLFAELR